jgi:extracellular elastinolytic metalloproteinase
LLTADSKAAIKFSLKAGVFPAFLALGILGYYNGIANVSYKYVNSHFICKLTSLLRNSSLSWSPIQTIRMTNFKYLPILLILLCLAVSGPAFSQRSPKELKTLISKNLNLIGITKEEADDCVINSNYQDDATGIEYVYIQQVFKSIKVFNVIISLAFKNGNLVHASGKFLDPSTSFPDTDIPAIEASGAVSTAARHLKLKPTSTIITKKNSFKVDKKIMFSADGIAKKDIETELLWAQDDSGKVHLAWNVSIDVENSNDWWNVRVDASTGEIVSKNNWTVHEKFIEPDETLLTPQQHYVRPISEPANNNFITIKNSNITISPRSYLSPNVQDASYLVVPYPFESRNFGSVSIDNDPWLKAGATNNATTYGWHFDGTSNYSITRGNNVYTYEDSLNINLPGRVVQSSTEAPFVNFNISPNFSLQPFDSINRNFGIVNLFYWNNIIHDVFYQYGFTEGAGNFQADNLGRGGAGNDYVRAEAQDGSGTDNANFSTPGDGASGRMQMYLFSGPPLVRVTAPASIADNYIATESSVSLHNRLYKVGPVTGQVVYYNDPASGGATHEACDSSIRPLDSLRGKIVYISRGTCPFTTKMRAAQNAGAIGVLMVNNVPGPPISFGTSDNGIIIPAVMVSQNDGARIAAEISNNVTMSMATGMLYDGGIDNGIVTHEYGHGISTRLTGGRTNASCLINAEQGGEGWSDYMALMVTTKWQEAQTTDGPKLRPMGTYALNQPANGHGIRRVPYTTNMLIDTLTYASMDGNITGNGEVHNIGEIWCSALWDMTWNIIQHEGTITADMYNSTGPGGNIIALKLVVEGMKLQPCRPGFLDARNAILAADSFLFNNKHKCDIWKAFARRGMGYSAVQGSSNSTADQVPAFDVPSGILITRSAAPSIISSGTEVSYSTTLTCQCQVPTSSYSLSDTIPAGFSFVRSNNGTLHDSIVKYNPVSFSDPLQTATLDITLKATAAGCFVYKAVNDDRETNVSGGLASEIISGTTNWETSQTHFFSTSNAWYAADLNGTSNFSLTSASFTPGNLSILSFWHYFVTENYLDGGKVEISSNNGVTWIDAKPYFLQNGYNALLSNASPQPNTYAFTGTSYATSSDNNGQFIQSVVDLSSFANQPVKIRFRFQTNNSNVGNQTYEGWYLDDIAVTNGCGGISRITLRNASDNKIDSVLRPFFILANSVLPLSLINFSAKQTGREVLLNWQTSLEFNTKNFEIERSPDGLTWTKIGTVPGKELSSNSYNFNDQNPLTHFNFYRIKINDRDGIYTYTFIKKIELGDTEILSLHPNPAINSSTAYFGINTKGGVLLVTDLEGRIMQRHPINDNTSFYVIPTGSLPSGNYFIRFQSKLAPITKKLIVAH